MAGEYATTTLDGFKDTFFGHRGMKRNRSLKFNYNPVRELPGPMHAAPLPTRLALCSARLRRWFEKKEIHREANHVVLDRALYLWFSQRKSEVYPISGPLLCEKALELNEKLGGSADFKASTGWLKNFNSRHGIRRLQIESESLSDDKNSAFKLKEIFLQNVEEKRLLQRRCLQRRRTRLE
ncbi:jerky-like protein [Trichonephila clavipes]|nr:jerky-like protein [Trichonephila clavipes]